MNHVTVRMDDGTTQIDHILVSRYGVFVIETKHHKGWIFANAADRKWTQVHYQLRSTFQNTIHQNYRHICAVRDLLDFLPPESVRSVVVFSGAAEFKTEMPEGVCFLDELGDHIRRYREPIISQNRMQFCVGRLETARLNISGKTDVEHVESLSQRFRGS
ncbi:MAG: nuclease-related domain-containing protein [Gemmatimonas sp.]